jgi:hypothetical protein
MQTMKTKESLVLTTSALGLALAAAILLCGFKAQAYGGSYWRVLGFNVNLAGHDLNGVSLNGDILDGKRVQAVHATDALIDGKLVEMTWLSGSRLVGINGRGRRIPGRKMVGAVFAATLEDGDTIALRIEDVRRHEERANRDVWLYDVTYESDDGWRPLCGADEWGDPIPAIPLEGTWDFSEGTEAGGSHLDDPSVFTFACTGYVLAKCVEAGYKPWRRTVVCRPGEGCERDTLAAHHQACTRMMRADYCGDGTPHTIDGSPVNIYDGLGIRYDALNWRFEAEWDEDGAICANHERIDGDEPPRCIDWLADDTCGAPEHFEEGTLLMTEVPY